MGAMKDSILEELARRWERMAEVSNTSEEVSKGNTDSMVRFACAAKKGETLRMCADTIRTLVTILGEPEQEYTSLDKE